MTFALLRYVLGAAAIAAAPAIAQHHHAVPYAGQQARAIKALSEDEVKGLLAGAGVGFAKAAELNRYPGPMHALEHADALELSARQRELLDGLLKRHKDEARVMGARVVELESRLDSVFASGNATADAVDRVMAQIGQATASLRGSHLKTHLATAALLTPAQVDRYVKLRGYAGTAH